MSNIAFLSYWCLKKLKNTTKISGALTNVWTLSAHHHNSVSYLISPTWAGLCLCLVQLRELAIYWYRLDEVTMQLPPSSDHQGVLISPPHHSQSSERVENELASFVSHDAPPSIGRGAADFPAPPIPRDWSIDRGNASKMAKR